MNQNDARRALLGLIDGRDFIPETWRGQPFAGLKIASATEKGDIGEDFLANILHRCGYNDANVVVGRRGHYDVRLTSNNRNIDFEVKVATQDSKGKFQFNGIRLDTRYTHLFCFGIFPDNIKFLIVPKRLLNNDDNYRMVAMARGMNAAFKLTRKEDDLSEFDCFENAISELLT